MQIKRSVQDLAFFGGAPLFAEKLHVGKPNIGDRELLMARLNDLLDRSWLTNNGPFVQEFERKVEALMGVRNCIAVCNGTIGLELAIRALGMTGEVIIPSFTFIATAHSLQWQGITPVFCDVDPQTHNIDPRRVVDMITPRTTGILGVHVWGRACDVDALTGIARQYGLKLIFDAAHAFHSSYQGKMIGGFGDAEVYSFHATKFFNTFEGGAVVTNNDELAEKIRLMRNFGFAGYDNVIYIGTNGKMSEVSAAMGLTGLDCLDEFIAANKSNYDVYRSELAGVPGVKLVRFDEEETNNYQYIILEIDESQAGISRDQLVEILHAENVLARRYFYPACHRMEPYRSYFPHAGLVLPETEKLVTKVMSLPNGTAVQSGDVRELCRVIAFCIENHREVSEAYRNVSQETVLQ